ncbi:unnamed protein product [Ranitomeya imitator]|uniref:MutL C-terminal dimerisation domain-containing protein n=1 Tax=Ranitomeya imitator TaxID=111125 RepID=A0ABN9LDL9_9NEOB|nr:unnamed protein product [Ranitomeya imitator]
MTTCSVPPNPRCSSIESASTASSYAMSEKTTSSVPHTATYPRCPGTGSEPLQKDISKFDVCTPISAPYPLPNARQKDRATKRAKNENHRHGSEPTNIQLCVASSLGGTLDKFKRRYGKKCPVDTDHQEQPTKSPGKSEAIHLISCAGTDIPPCAVRTTPPEPLDYVGIKQRESHHPQCSPTLTTKLCRLRNQSERWWGTGKPAPSAPHDLVSFDNDANRMPCEQQSTRRHRARSADDSLDGPMSHEWLHCYQESLGKSVFINTATGLSSYSAPNRDTPAACTKDFSNMAVNVVCSGGFQYQSHPFKSQTFLPFLPRPRHERDASGQTDDGALSSLYTEWTNPVYERHPALAVDVSREHSDVLSVKIHNILCPYRFTKEMVHSMKVLQQVDSKFIACVMEAGLTTASGGQLLVLVDQHAAHERVRLEQLIADSFQGSSEFCERRLKVSVVDPALEIHVSEEEYRILRTRAGSLGRLGLSLSFPDTGTPRILVSEIPLCFLEREANETQRGRRPVLRSIVQVSGACVVCALQENSECVVCALQKCGTCVVCALQENSACVVCALQKCGTCVRCAPQEIRSMCVVCSAGEQSMGGMCSAGVRSVGGVFSAGESSMHEVCSAGERSVCGVCSAGERSVCGVCSTGERSVCGVCSAGERSVCGVCSAGERSVCGVCSTGERSVCGVCSAGERSVCGVCSAGERSVCGVCSVGECSVCGVCSTGERSVCGVCSAGERSVCGVCSAGERSVCGVCSVGECSVCGVCSTGERSVCGVCSAGERSVCGVCSAGERSVCGVCSVGECSVCGVCSTGERSVCGVCSARERSMCVVCSTGERSMCVVCSAGERIVREKAGAQEHGGGEWSVCGVCSAGGVKQCVCTVCSVGGGNCSVCALQEERGAYVRCALWEEESGAFVLCRRRAEREYLQEQVQTAEFIAPLFVPRMTLIYAEFMCCHVTSGRHYRGRYS